MACWKTTMVTMLRVLINDLSSTPTYSDERLQQLIILAGYGVQHELRLTTSYVFDINNITITEDPVVEEDDTFVYFTVLKAACILDQGTFRAKALLGGIKARCGPAELDTVSHLQGFKDLLELGPCKAYETEKLVHNLSGTSHIKAVLSPFINRSFDPQFLSPPGHEREITTYGY